MSNTILLKKSGTANAIPGSGNLSVGELAINYTDGNLFYVDGGGTVKVIASNKTQTLTGNISAGNVISSGQVTATGNITGGNLITVGLVSATGNVTGNYFIGNGSLLTGIDATLISNGNSSVQTLANANITMNPAGTPNVVVVANTGAYVTGLTSVTGNVISGNVTTAGTANIATLEVTGTASVVGNVTVTANIAGGNISTAGNVAANGVLTDNYYYANGTPVDFQQAAGSNTQVQFNSNNDFGASAAFVFDSAANVLSVTGNVNSSNVNTGFASVTGNVDSGNVNTTLVAANTVNATTVSASGNVSGGNVLFGSGVVSGTGNVDSGNVNTGFASVTGNVDSGNVNTVIVTASGNITGGNLTTAGIANVGTLAVTGTATVSSTLSVTGNITSGNVDTAGLITATGNITGGNIITSGLVQGATVSATGSVVAGNITTAGTITATGNIQSNGTVVANTYTSVSDGITISPASGNINLFTTSSGNVILQNNNINNLAAPVQASDAVTKQYVDDAVSTGITIHTPVRVETPSSSGSLNATYAQGGTTYTVTDIVGNNTVVFSTVASLVTNDQLWFANSFDGVTANTAYFVVSTPNTSAAVLSTSYSGTPVSNLVANTGLTESVRVNSGQGATLTNAGANATLVIDGVTVTTNDRVLVYNQTNAFENGVYDVTVPGDAGNAWVLTRSSDMDTYAPDDINGLDAGDYFFVQEGSTGAGESYVMTSPIGPLVIGYDNLVFTQFSSSQVYSAANGIALTGTVFTANVDNDTTAIVSGNIVVKASANLTTPNIGAATGTSLSVTGNVVGGNIDAGSGVIVTTGNVNGGNVNTAIVSATGNITGGNIATAGTANVATLVVTTLANITSTTASINSTTGALIVAGGVGVAGNVYAGALYDNGTAVLTVNSTVDGGTY